MCLGCTLPESLRVGPSRPHAPPSTPTPSVRPPSRSPSPACAGGRSWSWRARGVPPPSSQGPGPGALRGARPGLAAAEAGGGRGRGHGGRTAWGPGVGRRGRPGRRGGRRGLCQRGRGATGRGRDLHAFFHPLRRAGGVGGTGHGPAQGMGRADAPRHSSPVIHRLPAPIPNTHRQWGCRTHGMPPQSNAIQCGGGGGSGHCWGVQWPGACCCAFYGRTEWHLDGPTTSMR